MFEENYSHSVITKKLSHNKGWVSKWTRRWKTNPVESLQSQSQRRLTNKTALNLTAHRIFRNSKYQTLHSTGRLASKFAFLSPIENTGSVMAPAVYASPELQTQMALERCLRNSWRSISFTTLQNLISLMPDRQKAVIRNKGDTVLLILSLRTVLK